MKRIKGKILLGAILGVAILVGSIGGVVNAGISPIGDCYDPFEPCDDSDPCTINDTCNASLVCVGEPKVCDDEIFCNGWESCIPSTGECGAVSSCPPAILGECVVRGGICDEENDLCLDFADDSLCSEGFICDEATDTCVPAPEEKVTVCHLPPGNPAKAKTLSIGMDSVADHLGHGDTLGPCP